jgi:hypothetical protein
MKHTFLFILYNSIINHVFGFFLRGMVIEMVFNNEIQFYFSSNHFIFLTLLKEL